MAAMEVLKITRGIDDKVEGVDERVQNVDTKVEVIEDKVRSVDSRVGSVIKGELYFKRNRKPCSPFYSLKV